MSLFAYSVSKSIASSIASRLDSIDIDGSNKKIDYRTWNVFAYKKGNTIKNYITLDQAKIKIEEYMNKEAKKTGKSIFDIGQQWLGQTKSKQFLADINKTSQQKTTAAKPKVKTKKQAVTQAQEKQNSQTKTKSQITKSNTVARTKNQTPVKPKTVSVAPNEPQKQASTVTETVTYVKRETPVQILAPVTAQVPTSVQFPVPDQPSVMVQAQTPAEVVPQITAPEKIEVPADNTVVAAETTRAANIPPETKIDEFNPDIEEELLLADEEKVLTIQALTSQPTATNPSQNLNVSNQMEQELVHNVTFKPITAEPQSAQQVRQETAQESVEPELTDNQIKSDDTDNRFFYKQKIMTSLNALTAKWNKNSVVTMPLIMNLADAISQINESDISQAQIIKVIKQTVFNDIKTLFNGNIRNTARFIKDVADTITNDLRDKDKLPTREEIVSTALAYCDAKISSGTEGNQYFSEGRRQKWCCDTATTIVLQVLGDVLPKDFDTSGVATLRTVGNRHKCYKETSTMRRQDRQRYIAEHVKPGDFMIERRGKSHTGVVIEVAEDGSWFKTVEGNVAKGTTVAVRKHSCDSKTLSGFISLDKYLEREAN